MLEIDVPGSGALRLRHLVLDYNGTLARDGTPLPEAVSRLRALAGALQLHVVTADTFGTARAAFRDLPVEVVVIPAAAQDAAKTAYVRALGAAETVAIGNGRNDAGMLREAGLGIAVVEAEGAASAALGAADVVAPGIAAALDLLLHPRRLVATLRS